MPSTAARSHKKHRAKERHREARYCTPCGVKGVVGQLCPRCSRPLTARTKGWVDAERVAREGRRQRLICPSCRCAYGAPYVHPTLGVVCPICLGALPGKRRDRSQARERTAVRESAELPLPGTLLEVWLSDQPGHPLGKGMPTGEPLRMDGESHSNAWRRILRADPCAYCGAALSGTVDHIEPRSQRRMGTERWVNLSAACSRCNTAKAAKPLLWFLLTRRHPARQLA